MEKLKYFIALKNTDESVVKNEHFQLTTLSDLADGTIAQWLLCRVYLLARYHVCSKYGLWTLGNGISLRAHVYSSHNNGLITSEDPHHNDLNYTFHTHVNKEFPPKTVYLAFLLVVIFLCLYLW